MNNNKIQSFEEFNEGMGWQLTKKYTKKGFLILMAPILFTIFNLMNPKDLAKSFQHIIDIYHNLDLLISNLESFLNGDITDDEKAKIELALKDITKIRRKWPTLDEYKKKLVKTARWTSIRNRRYLQRKIMDYYPIEWTSEELIKQLKKYYKDLHTTDVIHTDLENIKPL